MILFLLRFQVINSKTMLKQNRIEEIDALHDAIIKDIQ